MAENKPAEKKPHGLKGKPSNGRNSPVIGNNGLQVKPGDNSKFVDFSMMLMAMPKVSLEDEQGVIDRIGEFFKLCRDYDMKPAISGLAMALGVNRQRLWEIKTDADGRNINVTSATRDFIKKAYENMEILWENYMLNGKINPVSGIFLAKNQFGYVDVQEHVLTPNTALGQEMPREAIINSVPQISDGEDD